ELNLISAGRNFGWPQCDDANRVIEANADSHACDDATTPELTFEAHSRPSGITFYQGTAFPELQGDLLVVASGSATQRLPSGYALYRVCFNDAGNPEICTDAIGAPTLDETGQPGYSQLLIPVDSQWGYGLDVMHAQGQSFFPDHPVDVAVSPEGYIAISVMEGRLIQVRPAPVRLDESID
ncbi:MAG: PQQ-dependent sugar dehydrogenase, partial [Dehalococcoidia bacterium]|nr:PQQ-dependent sugar dehydrogenase [Dehalococcoidia bacterium]